MTKSADFSPPFSPILFVGLMMRPLSPRLLQPALDAAMAAMVRRHPAVFERLAALDYPRFIIDPLDLPFRFLLITGPERPYLTLIDDDSGQEAQAIVRGGLLMLIALLEGRIDGDALFFSRDLAIEGDTEAVVALRNAVDGEDIDLIADFLAPTGPLQRPLARLARGLGGMMDRAQHDAATLRAAILEPALRRNAAQARRLRELEEKVASLSRAVRRRPAARPSTARPSTPARS